MSNKITPILDLYVMATCPFCTRVTRFFTEQKLQQGIDFRLHDVQRDPDAEKRLLELGGDFQVPFLVHGDTRMYESLDIIKYIQGKIDS